MGIALALGSLVAAPTAQAWEEPAWGTQLRRELMDAVRPIVERDLGAPVRFVVRQLRIDGDRGFGWLEPQRPGGRPIPFDETPLAAISRGSDAIDGTTVHVFYRREKGRWFAEEWSIGATDAWWAGDESCTEFRAVIPEYCG